MEIIKNPIHTILMIDDDSDDCDIFELALKEVSPSINFICLHLCEDILSSLDKCSMDLIFLDINLPKVDGFNCLKEIQGSTKHCRIPIIMYSSSDHPKEINAAYGFGASLYFRKPTVYIDLVDSISNILSMNWDKPDVIKQQYFFQGKYKSYVL